jgi:hypothetical protein
MNDPILDAPTSVLDYLKMKVSPQILATIINRNVSYVYQEAQAGRLPNIKDGDFTYLECIQHYIEHYKSAQDWRMRKLEADTELKRAKQEEELRIREERKQSRGKGSSLDAGEDVSPLMAAKIKQDIRVGIAKESQMWQKTLIERGDYLKLEAQIEVAEPFIMQIKNTLIQLSRISPEAEKMVDEAMETLYEFGKLLVEGAETDKKDFIEMILAKDVTLDDIEVDSNIPEIL